MEPEEPVANGPPSRSRPDGATSGDAERTGAESLQAGAPAPPAASVPPTEELPAGAQRVSFSSVAWLAGIAGAAAALDLATKGWAKAMLAPGPKAGGLRRIEVIPGHFDFIYALNPGGAWSFLRGMPEIVRRPFFLFISAAAIVFIVRVYGRIRPEQRALRIGLPLALGGAIGNLVDRIRYGSVIDFIDIYFSPSGRQWHWPTFNVADIAIVVGVGLMAVDMMMHGRRTHAAPGSVLST